MNRKIFMLMFTILLILIGIVLVGCPPTSQPDLVPATAPGSNSQYASVDTEGKLVFYVENQGDADAPASITRVTVLDTDDTYDLSTPAVAAGTTVETEDHLARPDCGAGDCHLQITVDYNNQITESGPQSNNAVNWTLIG